MKKNVLILKQLIYPVFLLQIWKKKTKKKLKITWLYFLYFRV